MILRALIVYLCACLACLGYTDDTPNKRKYTNGTDSDVQSALDSLSADGWVIVYPNGPFTVSTKIDADQPDNKTICASNRNQTSLTASSPGFAMFEAIPPDTNHWTRFSGFNITGAGSGAIFSCDALNGGWTNTLRIDHCNFTNITGSKIIIWHDADRSGTQAGPYGLIDNNIFHQDSGQSAINGIYAYHVKGTHDRWTRTTNWGGIKTLVVESNLITRLGSTVTEGNPFMDSAFAGASYTFRDNIVTNYTLVAHGPDSAPTSSAEIEIYRNTVVFTDTSVDFAFYMRGGSYRIWSNNIVAAGTLNSVIKMANNVYPDEHECPSYPCTQQLGRGAHDGVESTEICYFWGNNIETLSIPAHVANGRDITNSTAVLGYQLGVHPMYALTYNAFVDGAQSPSDPGVTGTRDRKIARVLLR